MVFISWSQEEICCEIDGNGGQFGIVQDFFVGCVDENVVYQLGVCVQEGNDGVLGKIGDCGLVCGFIFDYQFQCGFVEQEGQNCKNGVVCQYWFVSYVDCVLQGIFGFVFECLVCFGFGNEGEGVQDEGLQGDDL